VVAVAVAPELVGWCWSLAVMDSSRPAMALGQVSASVGRLTPRGAIRDSHTSQGPDRSPDRRS
jgi:hypothetical protein